MHTKRPTCALRKYRRSWGLSQRELARLLGLEGSTHISRLEHGKRTPRLETALSCSTLFGVPLGDIFPQVARESGDTLRERICILQEDRPQRSTASVLRKRELFTRALGTDFVCSNRKGV